MNGFKAFSFAILGFALIGTLSAMVWAQAVLPLSGTKGASAINNGVNQFRQGNLDAASSHFRNALQKNPVLPWPITI